MLEVENEELNYRVELELRNSELKLIRGDWAGLRIW